MFTNAVIFIMKKKTVIYSILARMYVSMVDEDQYTPCILQLNYIVDFCEGENG